MRKWIFWPLSAGVLAVLNALIVHKESVLRSGEPVYLRLAPQDPRSLIQGDYMELRYDLTERLPAGLVDAASADGHIVIRVDRDRVGHFVRLHGGEPLAGEEKLLRYRKRGRLRLGAESFFFQEGHAFHYERARYAELRVTSSGESVLVGLRDDRFNRLGPPSHRE